jgi:L-alanine-DL-glutamate epimerase-like enolase superfamily enzyme
LAAARAAAAIGPMKITKVDAVRFRRDLRIQGLFPNWTWVRLLTDTGLIGIGASYATQEVHIVRSGRSHR